LWFIEDVKNQSMSPNDGFIRDVDISIEICNGQQYINNNNNKISTTMMHVGWTSMNR
jgi:hypothetical protein